MAKASASRRLLRAATAPYPRAARQDHVVVLPNHHAGVCSHTVACSLGPDSAQTVGLQANCRCAPPRLQVPAIYGVVLPTSVHQLIDPIRNAVEINIRFTEGPLQCLGLGGYLPWLSLVGTSPLVVMFVAPLLGLWLALGAQTSVPPATTR
eukprot:2814658-Prymnesium_polylepis.1